VQSDDKAQQPATGDSGERPKRPSAWKRWIVGTPRDDETARECASLPTDQLGLHATLRVLPTLLNSSSLPNGVVELLIDDLEEPARQLFDIHDGHVTLVEPGAAVPWASISGPPTAWADALGPARNIGALRLSGDEQLARRVLAALPRTSPNQEQDHGRP
jgi:hypothetical protein